jgi:hypothetical protein
MKNDTNKAAPTTLDEMLAKTCFCKLREFCDDKNSSECMRHRNIYAEFMLEKRPLKS